ncbi:hypothetical protein CGRA01v4_10562 [Colletotrichum graminicola]|uniref:DUF221 domain-containing protein n=1 Tax=Colletotrichum graminicola (strain M1.001 / M2 / FGSC 10212) TaxID=645133 RepID=E3QK81_COLGM|nr:uncharacterized protein GLRG_06413 [Colletotrichum graminicola M1.001]EFQ31269.1 hypothetical protein GLRG_06413 [Colletotrichum graminicola M1.001]WDK19275.1 hypothetical protein CGRA01v4_10562 [Colletotrichum graminicola]
MSEDAGKQLLNLIKNPYSQQLQKNSIWAALGTSLGVTIGIALTFSLLRPYNQSVYAPKLKHADEKHAPPPIGKKIWSWIPPLWNTSEADLVHHAGMDATIFLRFIRMCLYMFCTISVFCLAILIPTYLANRTDGIDETWLDAITPIAVWGEAYWAQVAVAYMITFTVMGFLWWNYRKVMLLRRRYFESEEYQNSLHARTLMMYDIPKDKCSDEGIARIIDKVVPSSSFSRTAIARNVKDLPKLIEQHDHTVRKLEQVLAKYMKKPDQLPAARPMCKPSKKDPSFATYPKGQKVDAIEYLTQRIKELEIEIREVRLSVDKRSTMPYGFASYSDIAEAHNIAYASRKKRPNGAVITLAPRPNDIIWDNLPLSSSVRRWRRIVNNLWIAVLTFVWVAPNAMIAIFLINLDNLGNVWPAFQRELARDPSWWAIVQGIASPAITSLVYLVLPIIFRRLSMKAGDQTKTGRERHVMAKLYAFFVFNNLIVFSLFSAVWSFVSAVVSETNGNKSIDAWHAIIDQNLATTIFTALCKVSPFWVTWLLQRNLGAAIDLAQLWTLVYSFFVRKFSSPTPRELIELTAPPSFDYAMYYNYFLYYATVALGFSGIQPLVLPAATLYYAIDYWLKKYLLLYIFVTKTESGGMFWRVLVNRMLFAVFLSNCVFFLSAWARADWATHSQALAIAPLPILLIIFKVVCSRVFDDKIHYLSTTNISKHPEAGMQKETRLRSERLASRFGHPALYKPLITPMVHQKAQPYLHIVYKGRLSDGREVNSGDMMSVSGYSDTYALDPMSSGKPGKSANVPGFEFVSESNLDFEFYKNRAEFADEHGQGDLFGRDLDIMRPGTPGSMSDYGSRPGTPTGVQLQGGMTGQRRDISGQSGFSAYKPNPPAYMSPTASGRQSPTRLGSPQAGFTQQAMMGDRSRSPLYNINSNGSDTALVRNAAGMPVSAPTPGPTVGALGGGPRGYSGLPQADADSLDQDPSQYDYFRGSRRRPNDGW